MTRIFNSFKSRCKKCGVLLPVPCWKYCEKCSGDKYDHVEPTVMLFPFKKSIPENKKSIILYDENTYQVLGFKIVDHLDASRGKYIFNTNHLMDNNGVINQEVVSSLNL